MVVLLALGPASPGLAATWIAGDVAGLAGDSVPIQLSFRGDGETVAADAVWVIDEARLTVDAPAGLLPSGGAGRCGWNGANAIAVVLFADNKPLPADVDTVVCTVPLRIRPNAPRGGAVIATRSSHCATADAQADDCKTRPGQVRIGGPYAAAAPAPPSALGLMLRLVPDPAGPSVEDVVGHDYAGDPEHAPLQSFRHQPPHRLRPLISQRSSGDARLALHATPASPDAMLERYVVAEFADLPARDRALALLERDAQVEAVEIDEYIPFAATPSWAPDLHPLDTPGKGGGSFPQYHLDLLNLPAAWARAGGWGLIGIPDNGLDPNHTELRSFTGLNSIGGKFVLGGNYLPYISRNMGGAGQPLSDLREVQPSLASPADTACDLNADGWLVPEIAGHGTHVIGLAAANSSDGSGISGACKNCGLGIAKISLTTCSPALDGGLGSFPTQPISIIVDAFSLFRRHGTQVISGSFGSPSSYCGGNPTVLCLALAGSQEDDVVVVAASGNKLTSVNFPAADQSVVAVGGLDEGAKFWDYRVNGSLVNCPYYDPVKDPTNKNECGSNASTGQIGPAGHRKQELVVPATNIRSTFYPGWSWGIPIACGDGFGTGAANDGSGLCTGTSMSTPQVAGIFGLLRSINPLLPVGSPFDASYGIRDVVVETASRAQAGLGWDHFMGYGIPDAAAAADRLLGRVRDAAVVNRLTPLFGLYSVGAQDYAAVATPQLAMALHLRQISDGYSSVHAQGDTFVQGKPVPGYPGFPNPAASPPRARALIFTTERMVDPTAPDLVPLFLLEKAGPGKSRDFILLASIPRVEAAVAAGYQYAGRQGYIYGYCTPSPTCSPPPGTEVLHLKCKPSINDCAVFLESDRPAFEAKGYTSLLPANGIPQLGYAYPVNDIDGDGLPDGFERVLGTSHVLNDSDADGKSDSVEYPIASVPVSDPCDGPSIKCPRPAWYIHADGFE